MPISFINKDLGAAVYVWELTEDIDTLLKKAALTLDEYERYTTFKAESRKLQWLAVRALVNKIFGEKVLIAYDSDGRPSIADHGFISISHTNAYVAVLLSPCKFLGVDIEGIGRNYIKIKSKFVTQAEEDVFKSKGFNQKLYLPIIWSAKEAAFKAAFRCELDFIRDITIVSVKSDEKFAVGEVSVWLNPRNQEGLFKFYTLNNHVIVWGEYGDI